MDQDNLHTKCSAFNADFNSVRFDPQFKESSIRAHQIWVYLQNARFLLLLTNLEREWLQIDTDLLRIRTSTADELSGEFSLKLLETDQDNLRAKLN